MTNGGAIWKDVPGAATAPRTTPAAVTIGTFDGVHRGHRHLVERTRAAGSPVVAVTFDPHPTAVVRPDRVPPLLTTVERRVELLHGIGVDEVRVLAFSREMAGWTAREFVERVVVDELSASAVVVGTNFTFGARAAGTTDLLAEIGHELGFSAEAVALAGEDADVWSSTLVRRLIAEGDMRGAAECLGRPHEVTGVVTRGEQRGRELGYPTANVPVDDTYAVPPDGVYAGRLVRASGEALPAAISIGTNPTFGEHSRRVESHVLDHPFDPSGGLDLYGEAVRVELVERLRDMVAFEGVDALLVQMQADVERTRQVVGSGPMS